nr:MAG TPA: hypothetical protein [Caudoviricetes sp.]
MNKTELVSAITEIARNFKVAPEALERIVELVGPQASGSRSVNPPKLNDKGEIVEAYCKYFQRYLPAAEMVISNGKSKGYSKIACAEVNARRKAIVQKEGELSNLVLGGKVEEAKKLAKDLEVEKSRLNDPEFYDYDELMKKYTKSEKPKVEVKEAKTEAKETKKSK